jgi:hypothetical protein
LSRNNALCRAIELSEQRLHKVLTAKKKLEEEKVQFTDEVEQHKRPLINMTLEMESMREELQTYKELPSTLKQRQLTMNR